MSGRGEGGIAGRSWAPWLRKVAFGLVVLTCLFALAVWLVGEVVPVIVAVIVNLFVVLAAALVLRSRLRGAGEVQRPTVPPPWSARHTLHMCLRTTRNAASWRSSARTALNIVGSG